MFRYCRFPLVQLEADIAAKEHLALIGDTGADRARHGIDASDGSDPKGNAGKEDEETGEASAHLPQRESDRKCEDAEV